MQPFLGQIQAFGFNFSPRGWAFCNGQLLPISQNTALFSLLGTIYGGDGRTTFALPDLRGRGPIHYGRGAGLSNYRIGQRGGVERVTLNTNQIPSHSHTANVNDQSATNEKPIGSLAVSKIYRDNDPNATLNSKTIGHSGGGRSHTNVQPYLAINWCIALVGTFPSRS